MTGRRWLTAYLVLVLCFMALPIVIVVVNSFNASAYGAWPPPGWSVRWYINLSQQADFISGAIRSVVVGVSATVLALIIGSLSAVALVRFQPPGYRFLNAFLLSPLIVPKVAIGLAGFVLFLLLQLYGSIASLVLAHIVLVLPFIVTIVGAALVRVDLRLEEAAMDLGASRVQAFWRVTVPQIRPSLAIAAALGFIISFDELDASIFIVSPQNTTLPVAMYTYMQKFDDPTLAALSTILILATLAVALLLFGFFGPSGLTQVVPGRRSTSVNDR